MLPDKFTISEDDLLELIKQNVPVEGYEDYWAEADPQAGGFDFEKGSAVDYPIFIYSDTTDDKWKAIGGYYNSMCGHQFYGGLEFTKVIKKERKKKDIICIKEDNTPESELKAFAAGYDQCIEDMASEQETKQTKMVQPIIIWLSFRPYNTCPLISWHLTKEGAEEVGMAIEGVQTYVGSDIHKQALNN